VRCLGYGRLLFAGVPGGSEWIAPGAIGAAVHAVVRDSAVGARWLEEAWLVDVRLIVEDRRYQNGWPRWPGTVVAVVGMLCLGGLAALWPWSPLSGETALPTGTPEGWVPLVMYTEPTPTPTLQPGPILYERYNDQSFNWDIWTMEADGGHKTRLTFDQARDSDATWSPDYSHVVFASERATTNPEDPNREIYVMNADGTGITRLTFRDGKDYDPSWSPDGTRIAFVSKLDGDWEIYLVNPNGTGLTQLTKNKSNETDPSWSPDGSRIAFASDRGPVPGQSYDSEIYTMKADGSDVKQLTNNNGADGDPSWSYDGTRIAFESDRTGDFEVWVMNSNGTGQVDISLNGADDADPSWQRWGYQIVFGSYRTGRGDIYVMNSNGSGVKVLTGGSFYKEGDPCARPSGP
jgi:Tol biopolymer transport system component